MDTKTILQVILRFILASFATVLAQHGIISATGTEQFVTIALSVVIALGTMAWSIWAKWGEPILAAQMEIWKLKAIARRDALVEAQVKVPPPPTAAQIEAATPKTVTLAVATKAVQSAPTTSMEHAA